MKPSLEQLEQWGSSLREIDPESLIPDEDGAPAGIEHPESLRIAGDRLQSQDIAIENHGARHVVGIKDRFCDLVDGRTGHRRRR